MDGEDRLPDLLDEDASELAEELRLPAEMLRWMRRDPVLLHPLLLPDEDGPGRTAERPHPRAGRDGHRGAAPRDVPRPVARREAGAARPSRRRLLSARPRPSSSPRSTTAPATSRWSTSATTAPSPTCRRSAVVEIPAVIDRDGAHPLPLAPLAPEQRALVQAVKAYEELTIEAARTGDREVAVRALAANPLVGAEVASPFPRRDPRGGRRAPGAIRDGLIRELPARRHRKLAASRTGGSRVVHPLRVSCAILSRPRPTLIPTLSETLLSVVPIARRPTRRRPSRPSTPRRGRRPAGSPSSSSSSSPASASSPRSLGGQRLRRAGERPARRCRQLENLKLPQEIVVLDRTGKTELARFGEFKRDVVTFDEIPPVLLDATTAVEDKTFWENAGFDPTAIIAAGIDSIRGSGRGASTITQQLVRANLLDPNLVQDPERTVERKLKEIIQSIRLTKAYPGRRGQAADHHRLPEQQLLRQPELRREGRRAVLLRQGPRRPDAGRGGDARGAAAVAVELRPRAQRGRRRATSSSTTKASAPTRLRTSTSSSSRTRRSPSAGTRSST